METNREDEIKDERRRERNGNGEGALQRGGGVRRRHCERPCKVYAAKPVASEIRLEVLTFRPCTHVLKI